jgi:LacI family transcriptional regulator
LIGLGHRRIGHIAGPDNISTGHGRRTGYRAALTRHGLPDDPALVVEGNFREQGGYEAMARLLALPEPPTAVFAVNDLAAAGALQAAEEAGLQVPRDLSLVGFNDLPTAVHTVPRLTTMRQPLQDMGVMAARRLLARLAGDATEQAPIVVPLTLVVRESTGPAPEARSHTSTLHRAT